MQGAVGKRIHSIKDMTMGESYPVQWTHADPSSGPWLLEWKKLIGTAELPLCGYKTFSFELEEAPPQTEPVTVTPLKMKNTFFSIELNSEFLSISSWRISSGSELLSSPIAISVFEALEIRLGMAKQTTPFY